MQRLFNLLALLLLAGALQTASAQSLGSLMKGGDFILKAGTSYWSMFDDFGGGSQLLYAGAEKPLGDASPFTATADLQLAVGGGGFFYLGTAGLRYYPGTALRGLNAGAWAVYDDGALGAGVKAGYQIPMGRLFLDLGAGPAYMAGSGGGGTFFMGTASVGFKFGR